MGARRRLVPLATVLVLALVAGPACKRKQAPAPPPASSAHGSDHLAKGEIPEGAQRAFGFPLPVEAHVKARFPTSVHVASGYSLEELAGFTRARVKDGKVSSGATETRFDNVVVKTDPSRFLTIEIRRAPRATEFRTQMVIRDVTPPPVPSGETDDDRWRRAGLRSDGRLLDPKHME